MRLTSGTPLWGNQKPRTDTVSIRKNSTLVNGKSKNRASVLLSRFNDQSESSYTQAGGNGAHPADPCRMKIWSDLHGNMQRSEVKTGTA